VLILIPVTCVTLLKVVSGKLYYELNEFLKVFFRSDHALNMFVISIQVFFSYLKGLAPLANYS
jgi:hypothetical protein